MNLEQAASENLNLEQSKAVNQTEGPLLILAGAGTGKTKVLTSRIAHIIENNLAYPSNILAVTFTNKASKEMQERVNGLIHADGLNIGTFHSTSARMLRSHISLLDLGLTSSFTIINQDDQIKLIKNIAIQNNVDVKQYPPKMIHIIISRWKDQGLLSDKLSDSDFHSPAHKISSRSEEHTSELQSHHDLVCRLLLENKHTHNHA